MSKFRRVADTSATPNYIEKQFFGDTNDDPYADLRAGQAHRKAQIARETIDFDGTAHNQFEYDWNAANTPATYQQPRFKPVDETLSTLRAADTRGTGVRRVGYSTDEGLNARPNPSDFFVSESDGMRIASSGALSIWENDIKLISAYMDAENEERKAMFDSREQAERRQTEKRSGWEQEKMAGIVRPRRTSIARASQVVRTSMENAVAGRFGMVDWAHLDTQDRERAEMQARAMEERALIKGKEHKTRAERNAEWNRSTGLKSRAQTLQDTTRQSEWGYDFNFDLDNNEE